MSLMVNTSRALREADALHALVHAVEMAEDEDETEWIEWKSHYDLRQKATHVVLARHIIGMANRRVDEAARFVEGFGYILVGVESHSRPGVTTLDFSELRKGIERYLGPNAPRWIARYDTIDGPTVLIIIVDPPRYGDPIHALGRDFEGYQKGTVYVRRLGSTERADSEDLTYLALRSSSVEGRAQATGQARWQAQQSQIDRLLIQGSSRHLPRLSGVANEVLGVTPTRYSIEGTAPYVARGNADETIRGLLAAPGPPFPFVVVWGATKAGKSRTLAEALRGAFTDDPIIVLPRDGQSLAELAWLGVDSLIDHTPAVVVLDDLDSAGLESLTTDILDQVRGWAVIAATMTAGRRAEVLTSGSAVRAIARTALAATSGEYELTSEPPSGAEKAQAERLYPTESFDGSIAETLVGARELIARYKASNDSNPAGCAVVQAAIDVRRAGLSRPVTDVELRRLFPNYLRTVSIGLAPTNEQFAEGIQWATRPVTSQVALLRPASSDSEPRAWVVFDHAVTADESYGGRPRPIPPETWSELIDMLPPEDAFSIGVGAIDRDTSIAAFRKAATGHSARAAVASAHLGNLLHEQADLDAARDAYQQAIDSGHAYAAPIAAYNLGKLLHDQGDPNGAWDSYQQSVDSGHPDAAPMAILNIGNLLREEGALDDARTVYQLAIDSGHADAAPTAEYSLGIMLSEHGDLNGARTAYQNVIDSGHPDAAPKAAYNLGTLLYEQGDPGGAQAAYQHAMDPDDPDAASMAAIKLGNLLTEQNDQDGARAAYRQAIGFGLGGHDPMAALAIAVLLTAQGDLDGACMAYQQAIDSDHADATPMAALGLGNLLKEQDDLDGAQAAYQQVIETGHRDTAPKAAFSLGNLFRDRGNLDGARAAYQKAIDSHHPDVGPFATYNLGILLAEQGNTGRARAAYQHAMDSSHADASPMAALGLGNLLKELGDLSGARTAYQQAIDSGHADVAPAAAVNLGVLLTEQGDTRGARAAFQEAIASRHADQAPKGAVGLGLLLTDEGDLKGARAAYQQAADSGHAEIEPIARQLLQGLK